MRVTPLLTNSSPDSSAAIILVSVVIDEVCMVLLFQPPDTIPDPLVPSTPPMCVGPQVKDEYIFTVIFAFIPESGLFCFPGSYVEEERRSKTGFASRDLRNK